MTFFKENWRFTKWHNNLTGNQQALFWLGLTFGGYAIFLTVVIILEM